MFGGLALVLLVPVLVALGATTLLRASAAAPLEGAARRARRRSVAVTVTTGLAGLAALVAFVVAGIVAACWPAPCIEAREAPAGALSGAEVP